MSKEKYIITEQELVEACKRSDRGEPEPSNEANGKTETARPVVSSEIVLPTARETQMEMLASCLFVAGIILLGSFDWRIGVGTLLVSGYHQRENRKLTRRQNDKLRHGGENQ